MDHVDARSFQQALVEKIKAKMHRELLSYRNCEDQAGVSASSMSRLLNGKEVSATTIHKLERWLEGGGSISRKATKRLKLAGKDFLITIEVI